jgi:membrane protease subunit HflK
MKNITIHPVEQGPWGKKGGGGSSGGDGGGWMPNGKGRGPNNSGDIEDILRDLKRYMETLFGKDGGSRGIIIAFGIFFLLWLASGFYTVQPGEQGVVLRFGKFDRIATSGLNYHWPAPFESLDIVNTEAVRIESMGSEGTGSSKTTSGNMTSGSQEILMLTGDENIIDLTFNVQWNVRDAQDYVFNITNPDQTVRAVTESAMREVVGRTPIGSALTEGKSKLQEETQKLTQETLDRYKSGIQVLQVNLIRASFPLAVVDAARDVQAARADQERLRNEADAYRNDIIPRARGAAQRMVQDAEGYKSEVVAKAEGDAARFVSVYTQYRQAEDVTRKRMYLETMEKILGGMNKMVLDSKTGATPYLPLPALAPKADDKKEAQ